MILYHGTAHDRSFTGDGDVKLIGRGEFGCNSFYLSFTPDEAEQRAYLNANQGMGKIEDTRIMKFNLDETKANVYDFGDFSEEWLEYVHTNKLDFIPDVIIGGLVDEMGRNPGLLNSWRKLRKQGPVDKKYTKSVVNQLKTDIKLQVAIKTQKGIDALEFLGSQDV